MGKEAPLILEIGLLYYGIWDFYIMGKRDSFIVGKGNLFYGKNNSFIMETKLFLQFGKSDSFSMRKGTLQMLRTAVPTEYKT